MKIVKSANSIGFLNQLVFPSILTDSQPLDISSSPVKGGSFVKRSLSCIDSIDI